MGGALPAVDAALVAASGARRAGAASATDDDRALAARAATDPEAFAQLYRRYVGPVYELAHRRSRSREVAEDVTSATFEKALQSMERFEWRRGGFRAWLYRIAANELTDHFRRRSLDASPRAQRSLQALAGPGDDGGGDGFEAVDQRLGGEGERVLAALDGLSPRYQEALSLRFMCGLSPGEAAAALGCSRGTLAVVVHRALGALRRELGHQPGGVATPRGTPEEVAP